MYVSKKLDQAWQKSCGRYQYIVAVVTFDVAPHHLRQPLFCFPDRIIQREQLCRGALPHRKQFVVELQSCKKGFFPHTSSDITTYTSTTTVYCMTMLLLLLLYQIINSEFHHAEFWAEILSDLTQQLWIQCCCSAILDDYSFTFDCL